MAKFRLFYVITAKIRRGKAADAVQWWHERGKQMNEAAPGVKSVAAYITQFALGPSDYQIEIWMEIENYAAFDRVDQAMVAHPEQWIPLAESEELLEWGHGRIVGDWPQSGFFGGQ